jgi:hypothetical protein
MCSKLSLIPMFALTSPLLAQSIGSQGPAVTPSQAFPHAASGTAWLVVPMLWIALVVLTATWFYQQSRRQ